MTRTYDVTAFGAVTNNELQTDKFQAAIDRAFLDGGGEVAVPEGIYHIGSIRLRSRVTLHLLENAVLMGSRDPEDYMSFLNDTLEPINDSGISSVGWIESPVLGRWNNGIIRAIDACDIAIVGDKGSVINGGDCYDELGEEGYRGPHALSIHRCRNVDLRGYTIVDSANWAHAIFSTQNIRIRNITVLAGHDGVDVFTCDNVVIEDCSFITGDDCIAGFDDRNVFVKNCVLNSSCQAIRFGGVNAIFSNCKIYGPGKYAHRFTMSEEEKKSMVPTNASHRHNMHTAMLYYCGDFIKVRDLPSHIVLRDCEIDCLDRLLSFDFYRNKKLQTNMPLQSIRFENMIIRNVKYPSYAWGSLKVPVILEFINVDFSFDESSDAREFLRVCNFERVTLTNVTVEGKKLDALVRVWSQGKTEFEGVQAEIPESSYIKPGEDDFFS